MATVEIIYQGIDNGATSTANSVTGALGGLANMAGGALSVATGEILASAFATATSAIGDFLGQALDAEKQQAGLAALIKSTGDASGLTQQQVNDLAQQFKGLAGGSDEAIVAIEEIGIRSGAISANEMPAFIQNVTDLGAVMGDTSAAATLLARAQEDPIAALGKLQRAGILFSDTLKEQIKDLAKSGDTAGATALIMQRVAEATGGSAAAAADTMAGRWEIMSNELQDAGKGILTAVLPALEQLFDTYIKPNIPIIEQMAATFATKLGPALQNIITVIQNLMTGGTAALGDTLKQWGQKLWDWVAPMIPPLLLELGKLEIQFINWLIAQVPPLMAQLQAWGVQLWAWVAPMIPPLIAELEKLAAQAFAWIQAQIPPLIAQLLMWGREFVNWVGPQIPPLLAQLGLLLGQMTAWIITTGVPALVTQIAEWAKSFADWVMKPGGAKDQILPALNSFILAVGGFVVNSMVPAFVGFAKSFIDGLLAGFNTNLPTLVANVQGIGQSIISGIVAGINAAPGAILSALSGIVNGAIDAIKRTLGISSPSKVFASIGGNMMEGLAQGITGNAYQPAAAMSGAVGRVTNSSVVNNYNLSINNASGNTNVPLAFGVAASLGGAYP